MDNTVKALRSLSPLKVIYIICYSLNAIRTVFLNAIPIQSFRWISHSLSYKKLYKHKAIWFYGWRQID